MTACDWTDYVKNSAGIVARVARGEPADEPVSLTWHSLSPVTQRRCTEDCAARKYPLRPLPPVQRVNRGRIRLAYMSSDFREHPMP